jgi:uncharacterized damage-inducible protein DinB
MVTMTIREFYLDNRKHELPVFQRVLAALPKDQFHYKPHDRSPSTEQIVWTMVQEMKCLIDLIDTGELTFAHVPPPSPDEMIAIFNQYYETLNHKAAAMGEDGWHRSGKFVMGGKVRREQPVGGFLFGFHQDMIHHRGQLSTYIRPMGGKVPSIYGPSGDDAGPLG